MPHPPSAGVVSIDVRLRPEELVAAWRADSRRLVLQTAAPLRAQQRVAVRITLTGREASATITGRVTSTSRQGGLQRVELAPDDTRLRALERLLAVARGENVAYQPRMPRLLASLPAVVNGRAGPTYMTTISVSENGCGLAWSGPLAPTVGAELDIRLGAGNRAVTFRGVVCWAERTGSTATAGVRFVAGARHAWTTILTEARRSGAPPA